MKKTIMKDLKDEKIAKLCNQIYYVHAKNSSDLYIEYQILNKKYNNFASNRNLSVYYSIQIDVFSKYQNTFDLEETLEEVLKSKGYRFISSNDLYEEDTGLYHVALRFSFTQK